MKLNAFGWPMEYREKLWAGKLPGWTPICPACGSDKVEYKEIPIGRRTGPQGRYRVGDPYRVDCVCTVCGKRETKKMDPDTNLEEQNRLAESLNKKMDPHKARRLADLVEALNEWISNGGFLPKRWKHE